MSRARLVFGLWAMLAVLLVRPVEAAVFKPTYFVLKNGLQVIVVTDHRTPAVTQMLWYKVGAADEPPGKSGIAHYLEHLMFKGTRQVAPGDFSRLVAAEGGRDNAFTGHDYTAYHQTVARDRLEMIMRMEADRMVNLQINESLAAPELKVVLEERSQRTDNSPGAQFGEQVAAAQFLAHAYGRPVIGWEHEIRGLTWRDAVDFYRAHYAPNNAILTVVGDVEPDEVRRLAEKYYGPIPARTLAPRLRPQEPPQRAQRRVVFEDARVRQPSLSRSYLAPTRTSADSWAADPLSVLAEILNGGGAGRLHKALVAGNGVASSAFAWSDGSSLDMSRFGFSLSPKEGRSLADTEAALDQVLAELLHGGVTADEVARATRSLKANAVFARDNIENAARSLGSALARNLGIEEVENWPERIGAVSADDVNRAARLVFDPRRSVTGELRSKPREPRG